MFQLGTRKKEIIQMKKYGSLLAITFCVPVLAFGQSTKSEAKGGARRTPGEPELLGFHGAGGFDPSARVQEARAQNNPLMTYQGGKIMTTAVTQNIFWGTSWTNSSLTGDKISGLDTWYAGFSNSNYAATSDEYTGTNGQVGPTISYLGHLTDSSQSAGGGSTSVILGEVCKMITNPDPSGNGYYSAYIDTPRRN